MCAHSEGQDFLDDLYDEEELKAFGREEVDRDPGLSDEEGSRFAELIIADGDVSQAQVEDPCDLDPSEYLTADQHFLYEVPIISSDSIEEQQLTSSSEEERQLTSNVRGRRPRSSHFRGSGYGRGRAGRISLKSFVKQTTGVPLTEIYATDNDVPDDLKTLIESAENNKCKLTRFVRSDDEDEDIFETTDSHFQWYPMNTFVPKEEPFKVEHVGSTKPHLSAYDAFRSYWDDEILNHIVKEINSYANKIPSARFQAEWVPTNVHEVLVLFSFWMMLGIIRMPTIKSCFSTDRLLETTAFKRMFTRNRYQALVRAFHFVDSADDSVLVNRDRISKIRPILTHLNTQFQSQYTPSQNICIDESLILWKSNLHFRQNIRNNAAKFGIKTYELCESVSGYLWSFLVDTGTVSNKGRYSKLQKITAVVMKLVKPLLNKGYRLFMNSWYNSPFLARFLKRNGTDCVGTLQPDRRHVPPLVNLCSLRQGQILGRHSGDVCVMAWQGTAKKVTTISTCHGINQGLATVSSSSSKDFFKPQVVLDCNKFMGGVDLKDQQLEPYLLERKRCIKWYTKLFKRLLICSILNARILLESSSGEHQDHLDFRLRLVRGILDTHLSLCPVTRGPGGKRHNLKPSSRGLQMLHWPVRVPTTANDAAKNRHSRRQCHLCTPTRKTQKTPYMCEHCGVPLCIEGCFKAFHLLS